MLVVVVLVVVVLVVLMLGACVLWVSGLCWGLVVATIRAKGTNSTTQVPNKILHCRNIILYYCAIGDVVV